MRELKFSVCNEVNAVHDVLKPFNENRPANAQVNLQWIPWDQQKKEMTSMALYGQGVDVSQVGGPVVSDLVSMNALRPFSSGELDILGGGAAYSQMVWNNSRREADEKVYAIPWIVDARAIIFWRDMLEDAGVDENTAFTSFENMEAAFAALQKSGVQSPWALALNGGPLIQPACTWIWGAGGDVGNQTEITILQPQALRGLRNFFNLYRYMPKANQPLDFTHTYYELVPHRQVAVTIGTLANYQTIKSRLPVDMQSKLGVALAPAPLFFGSSSLVIWKNTRDEVDAVNLIRYMLSDEAQEDYCKCAGFIPVRLNLLSSSQYSADPVLSVFTQSAFRGRSLAGIKLSGLFEEQLSAAIRRIWARIIDDPEINLDLTIMEELEPIVRRSRLWNE